MTLKKSLITLALSSCILTAPQEVLSIRKPVRELAETPIETYTGPTLRLEDVYIPETKQLAAPRVKNQDPLGTCTIFTATGLYETNNLRRGRMSEAEFTVYAETQIDDCVEGINLGRTLKLAQRDGFIPESSGPSYEDDYVPYVARANGIATDYRMKINWYRDLRNLDDVRICSISGGKRVNYNRTMSAMGSSLKLEGFYGQTGDKLGPMRLLYHTGKAGDPDLDQVKLSIANGYPVAVAADVYDNCWSPGMYDDPRILLPGEGDDLQGSHAFMLTGFDGDDFVLRNSWGEGWAKDGYAWMPGEYLSQYATEIVAVGK